MAGGILYCGSYIPGECTLLPDLWFRRTPEMGRGREDPGCRRTEHAGGQSRDEKEPRPWYLENSKISVAFYKETI